MPDITSARGYAIGEMQTRTGVKIETIRYYERIALMPTPDRTAGGNRQYNHPQLKQLFFIKRSRELGFSIKEIRALLSMAETDGFSCGEVYEMTTEHLGSIREKIVSLKRLETALSSMAEACNRGEMEDCPILDTLFEAS